jgi:hypothetical protein
MSSSNEPETSDPLRHVENTHPEELGPLLPNRRQSIPPSTILYPVCGVFRGR